MNRLVRRRIRSLGEKQIEARRKIWRCGDVERHERRDGSVWGRLGNCVGVEFTGAVFIRFIVVLYYF